MTLKTDVRPPTRPIVNNFQSLLGKVLFDRVLASSLASSRLAWAFKCACSLSGLCPGCLHYLLTNYPYSSYSSFQPPSACTYVVGTVHLNAPITYGPRAPWSSKYATDSAPQLSQPLWVHEQASARWVVQLGHLCHSAIGCWQRHRVKQRHISTNSHNGTTLMLVVTIMAEEPKLTRLKRCLPIPACWLFFRLTIAPTASQNRYDIRSGRPHG
ncbi:hypothetical protein FVEG_15597 [Fusarium verticillioides 7600]|uniref:Uncharacterized protein n=1 Tax=Gibberella moniliformis (strain M3125 / FGSC 7600) TaxID=334819 RepID=W7LWX3_GIBM7|nr:hypothetical protein FVEG_15597 [Fusarium verticillioides 7600]EWG43788.1 hypothetical protein FVEG_15597 [Fusarium verticillioides 7600]